MESNLINLPPSDPGVLGGSSAGMGGTAAGGLSTISAHVNFFDMQLVVSGWPHSKPTM